MGQIIDAIVSGLASVIKAFATIGGGNTAIGIILFTVAIRFMLLPLTLKAVRSSRAMQQLQPLIKEINGRSEYKTKPGERLPSDKAQKKQAEIMGLYSQYSVNPAAGCLPVLIQIPVFFAVYAAVTRSIGSTDAGVNLVQHTWNFFAPSAAQLANQAALNNSGILWVHDLTQPDPLHILPVLMVVFQFMTQKMAIPKGGGADEQQRRINSIMQWTPLIFGFTAFSFPCGPVIYWVTTSIFSTIQQFFITGFGSLSDIPGLGFLPVKKLPTVELKKRDPQKPVKPGLMQRMMEQQDRLQSEQGRTKGAAADASGDKIETEVIEGEISEAKNNFGRKLSNGNGNSGGTIRRTDTEITPARQSETRAINQEEAIRQAYQNLNRRPPKKSGGPAAGGSTTNGNGNGNSNNLRKKK